MKWLKASEITISGQYAFGRADNDELISIMHVKMVGVDGLTDMLPFEVIKGEIRLDHESLTRWDDECRWFGPFPIIK
jgi:hypothetical protein